MTPNSSKNVLDRLANHLAGTEFFTNFRKAFAQLTGLPLVLEAARPNESLLETKTEFSIAGVAETKVPVKVGKTLVATLRTGGVRLLPPSAESFAPVAAAMLDNDHSAPEINDEKARFLALAAVSPELYDAALAMLKSFAFQLGETAHRLLFATSQNEPEGVRQAKAFIMGHLAEPLTLEEVAGEANVSPFHFCKIFKRATGMTFTDFVGRARVEKAKRLLMRPEARITEVAYDVGFQSLSHFNRSFRRVVSESPSEFRSRMRSERGGALLAA